MEGEMRSVDRRWGWASLGSVVVVVSLLSACTGPVVRDYPPSPDISVWMVGDSLASGTAADMVPRPYAAVSPAAGFTTYPPTMVIDTATEAIEAFGAPETMLVMAGVGDTPVATTEESIAGIEEFVAAMEPYGMRIIWIAEPGYSFAEKLEPLSQWMFSQPESIDCRFYKGTSTDGVHPFDYTPISRCVSANLVEMGVEFTVPQG
jgi:hypothetical protein